MEKYRKGCLCGEGGGGGGVLASRQGKAHQLSSSPDNYTPEHLLTWTPGHLDNCTPAHLDTWTPEQLHKWAPAQQFT